MKRQPNLLDQGTVDATVRMPAIVVATPKNERERLAEAAIARIRQIGDPDAKLTVADVYPFRAIAASDGLDSYFTKHDVARGLLPMAADFSAGRSVLGNHDYGTFSYGSTFGAEVVDAQEDAPEYEAAFYPKYAGEKRFRTGKWLVSSGYVTRGMADMGGQASSDSVIRGMESGGIRRISISFIPGSYQCGIDGKDMVATFFGPMGDEDDGCSHFPGVDYGEDGPGHALMLDSRALEKSLVYMNASPSAMLLRKAEVMASRGMLRSQDKAIVESRFGIRLPAFERRLFVPGRKEEPNVDWETLTLEAAQAGLADGSITQEDLQANRPDLTSSIAAIAASAAAEDEDLSTVDRLSAAVEDVAAADLSEDDLAIVLEAERAIERLLNAHGHGVGRETSALHEARIRAVTDELGAGVDLDVTTIRSLKVAKIERDRLVEDLIDQVVRARVGVQGEGFDAEPVKQMLRASTIDGIKGEIKTWTELKGRRFVPHRQTVPAEVRSDRPGDARKIAPERGLGALASELKEGGEPNILAKK